MSNRAKLVLTSCVLLSFCTSYYFFALLLPAASAGHEARHLTGGYGYGNDFYQIWFTTKELLAQRADPYRAETQRNIEIGLYGRPLDRTDPRDASVPYRGYSYPLPANILTAPLGWLSFRGVQIILSVLLPLCVVGGVIFWCRAFGLNYSALGLAALCVVAFGAFPVLEGIYALQTTLIVTAAIAGCLALLRRNRLAWAGVTLSLGCMKPHLIALLAVWLTLWAIADWSRRKAFLIAFLLSSLGLLLVAELWFPGWGHGWLRSLPAYRQINSPPLLQFLLGQIAGGMAGIVLLALASVAAWRWRRDTVQSSAFLLVTSYVLALTVVMGSSSVAVYNQFLLFPGLLWLWSERQLLLRADRLARMLVLLLLFTFAWPWITSALLTPASFVLPWARSYRAVLLPLATAATFPLATLALMTILLWRGLRASEGAEGFWRAGAINEEP